MKNDNKFSGLNRDQIQASRAKFGENIITPREKESVWKLFFEKFEDPMIRILLVAACLSLVVSVLHNEYAETIGIFFAIFLATGIAFWFEKDAQNKFNELNKVTDQIPVKVIRDGVVIEVAKSEIVVGDIVIFEAGEEIPADGDLLESNVLLIDESSLTGELSIHKTTIPEEFDEESTYPSNWVYKSTKVLEGSGVMRVMTVGDATEYGKVAQQSTEKHGELTPLALQLESLAKLIGVCGFSLAILIFYILLFKELFSEGASYSYTQLVTLFVSLFAMSIAVTKVWMPILMDFLTFAKIKSKLIDKLSQLSWGKNILISVIVWAVTSVIFTMFFGVNFFTSSSWLDFDSLGKILQFFMIAVTLIVVSIPEGLPMSVTLSLALSMRRMLKTNNLVRKMHACETMGATTVICTDKTGTLTQNQMRVHQAFFQCKTNFEDDSIYSSLVSDSLSMNTTAFLDYSDPAKVKTIGNPTEAALLLWCDLVGIEYQHIRKHTNIVDRLVFSTERKYMATIIDSVGLKKRIFLMKGAPEVILSKCTTKLDGNDIVNFDSKSDVNLQLAQMQEKAMRTLAFGFKEVADDVTKIDDVDIENLTYVGFVAIADPVREDVGDAIKDCLKASIQVKVVTGDTSVTAKEIARQIGLWSETDTDVNIITGLEFEALTDEEAYERAPLIKIMCRARPTDKQRLVGLLQKRGEIVAVTGDGTNDAPALNKAHVGLSMGTGTAIAKEASDITLLDDSFSSIVSAVIWGRSLYLNIQRFIVFQLIINLTAVVVVLCGAVFGVLTLTVTQMLWVNLIMDTFAAGALASLPPSRKLLNSPPRSNSAFIITRTMATNIFSRGLVFITVLLAFMYVSVQEGEMSVKVLTQFFTTFVLLQFWNMFNAKVLYTNASAFSDIKKSMSFMIVSLLILVGQYLIVTFGGEVFRTVPLSWADWGKIFGLTSIILVVGEIERLIARIIEKRNNIAK